MGDRRPRVSAGHQPKDERNPQHSGTITDLLRASSDIVLIVDDGGVVREISIEDEDLARSVGSAWLGQPLVETVTVESRGKVERMLGTATGDVVRQEINHTLGDADLPVRYAAVRLAPEGPVAVLGRDLRDIARLQQQLVDANVAAERDYALHRATEIQFRVLFQHTADAVVIADAVSRRILDANPKAEDLLRRTSRQLAGSEFERLFPDTSARDLQDGFAAARAMGQALWPALSLRQGGTNVEVAAWLIRSSAQPQLLLRLVAEGGPPAVRFGARWEALRRLPEPLVATDQSLVITDANESFLDLVGAATLQRVRGEPLSRFLGRNDLGLVLPRLKEGDGVRRVPVSVQDHHGIVVKGEASAASDRGATVVGYCFLLRSQAVPAPNAPGRSVFRAPDEMTGLVGRMPLREIVRETADIIEELCIEAALELTRDNRASAAEMLGLSRQSLYAKLRRYGLGNLPADEDDT
jgi:transcriptional regulator PpsR